MLIPCKAHNTSCAWLKIVTTRVLLTPRSQDAVNGACWSLRAALFISRHPGVSTNHLVTGLSRAIIYCYHAPVTSLADLLSSLDRVAIIMYYIPVTYARPFLQWCNENSRKKWVLPAGDDFECTHARYGTFTRVNLLINSEADPGGFRVTKDTPKALEGV